MSTTEPNAPQTQQDLAGSEAPTLQAKQEPAPEQASRTSVQVVKNVAKGVLNELGKRYHGMWHTPEGFAYKIPEGDFRDSLPPRIEDLSAHYQAAGLVADGKWTFGLFDMWAAKSKIVKHAVHMPCGPSCRFNPLAWRGIIFGRTCYQCFFYGMHEGRWARYVYATEAGREYMCTAKLLRCCCGAGMLASIAAMTLYLFLVTFVLGLPVHFIALPCTCMGHVFNPSGCYTCHSREKIRRKYSLPSSCCLPPGLDDCVVHAFCMYCAVHQEMRELAVRGVDGPGLHVLDIDPLAWSHVPGWGEEMEYRIKKRKELEEQHVEEPVFPNVGQTAKAIKRDVSERAQLVVQKLEEFRKARAERLKHKIAASMPALGTHTVPSTMTTPPQQHTMSAPPDMVHPRMEMSATAGSDTAAAGAGGHASWSGPRAAAGANATPGGAGSPPPPTTSRPGPVAEACECHQHPPPPYPAAPATAAVGPRDGSGSGSWWGSW